MRVPKKKKVELNQVHLRPNQKRFGFRRREENKEKSKFAHPIIIIISEEQTQLLQKKGT